VLLTEGYGFGTRGVWVLAKEQRAGQRYAWAFHETTGALADLDDAETDEQVEIADISAVGWVKGG
jgi:hypothetical protein